MEIPCNFILLLGVSNNLFPLQPKLLRLFILGGRQFVVCGSTAESTLLRSVGTIRIFPILEIEADLIEAFLGYKVIFLAEITTIYDGIDELSWI
jgi:hypothetical protein